MTKRLKINSPYDGHLIDEIDLDDAERVENVLETAHKLALDHDKIISAPRRIEILEKTLSTINYDNFNEVYVFDIHTGLGKYGNLSVMVSEQNTVKDLIHLPYNPTTKLINMGTDNMYRDSKGSIVDGIDEYLTKKNDNLHIYPIILEYGTYHNLRMFFGLLMENYYYCKKDKDQWSKSNQRLKSLFYIQDDDWQNLVIENYTDFITILM